MKMVIHIEFDIRIKDQNGILIQSTGDHSDNNVSSDAKQNTNTVLGIYVTDYLPEHLTSSGFFQREKLMKSSGSGKQKHHVRTKSAKEGSKVSKQNIEYLPDLLNGSELEYKIRIGDSKVLTGTIPLRLDDDNNEKQDEINSQTGNNVISASLVVEDAASEGSSDIKRRTRHIEASYSEEDINGLEISDDVENIDSLEATDGAENIDSLETTDGAENIDSLEASDGAENTDNLELSNSVENIDNIEASDSAENTDSLEATDDIKNINYLEASDGAKNIDNLEASGEEERINSFESSDNGDGIVNIMSSDKVERIDSTKSFIPGKRPAIYKLFRYSMTRAIEKYEDNIYNVWYEAPTEMEPAVDE
jgi:hypothetical protein